MTAVDVDYALYMKKKARRVGLSPFPAADGY
jgi:hypothetical protein